MDYRELIRSRRTVHEFDAEAPVDWRVVEAALEDSLWALNHRLTFPWKYLRVGQQARQQLAKIQLTLQLEEKGLSAFPPVLEAQIKSRILNPKELIVLGLKKNPNPDIAREDYATLAASVQIMSLSLWRQDIGSKWSTGKVTKRPELYELFQWSPEEIEICGFLFIGRAKEAPRDQNRPALSQFLQEIH